MTRKRFIKLLMSKGIQRNEANQISRKVREYGGVGLSYKSVSNGEVRRYVNYICYFVKMNWEDSLDFSRRRSQHSPKRTNLLSDIMRLQESGFRKLDKTGIIVEYEPRKDGWWMRSPVSSNMQAFSYTGVVPGFCI